jgi:hypothetical protein
VNTAPGMTDHSLVPMAARVAAWNTRRWCVASSNWLPTTEPMNVEQTAPAERDCRPADFGSRRRVAGCAAVWLVRVPSLPVRQVVFAEELAHTRRRRSSRFCRLALKGNFFSLNLERCAVRWKTALGAQGRVRRIWPARLEVKVEEHRPLARWGEGRGELVNSYGEVFAAMPR